ncbi:MAG: type II toxin-antitoxin system VapC family toxin [Spirochaetaceae bacterium]
MTYLLDTSVYGQPLKRHPVKGVVERWQYVGDLSCCVSVFCELEVLQGLRTAGSQRLNRLYHTVLRDRIPVLPFTLAEASRYADLQAQFIAAGRTRPVIDLCIAATALEHGCIVATLNAKDFEGIPGLVVEDWSA